MTQPDPQATFGGQGYGDGYYGSYNYGTLDGAPPRPVLVMVAGVDISLAVVADGFKPTLAPVLDHVRVQTDVVEQVVVGMDEVELI